MKAASFAETARAPSFFPDRLPELQGARMAYTLFRRQQEGPYFLAERGGYDGQAGRYDFLGSDSPELRQALDRGWAPVPDEAALLKGRSVWLAAAGYDERVVDWLLVAELDGPASSEAAGAAVAARLNSLVERLFAQVVAELPVWLRSEALALAALPGPVLLLSEPGCGAESLARMAVLARYGAESGSFFAPARLASAVQLRELFGERTGRRLGGEEASRVSLIDRRAVIVSDIADLSRAAQLRLHSHLASDDGIGQYWLLHSTRHLEAMAGAGKFDGGLWAAIRDERLILPPVRAIRDQLPAEVRRLLSGFRAKHRQDVGIAEEALQAVVRSEWPGNWHQLSSVLEAAFLLASGGEILAEDLQLAASSHIARPQGLDLRARSDELEREMILAAFAMHSGNQVHMAAALGISRGSLQYKLEKLGLADPGRDRP